MGPCTTLRDGVRTTQLWLYAHANNGTAVLKILALILLPCSTLRDGVLTIQLRLYAHANNGIAVPKNPCYGFVLHCTTLRQCSYNLTKGCLQSLGLQS